MRNIDNYMGQTILPSVIKLGFKMQRLTELEGTLELLAVGLPFATKKQESPWNRGLPLSVWVVGGIALTLEGWAGALPWESTPPTTELPWLVHGVSYRSKCLLKLEYAGEDFFLPNPGSTLCQSGRWNVILTLSFALLLNDCSYFTPNSLMLCTVRSKKRQSGIELCKKSSYLIYVWELEQCSWFPLVCTMLIRLNLAHTCVPRSASECVRIG